MNAADDMDDDSAEYTQDDADPGVTVH